MNQVQAVGSQHAVQQMFDRSLCRMQYDLRSDQAPWSVASFGGVRMVDIDLYRDEAIGGRRAVRSRADIAENPCQDFLLAMPFDARIDLEQSGEVVYCEPGAAVLFSIAQPFDSTIEAAQTGARYTQFLSRISGAALRRRLPQIDELHHTCFGVDSGAGRIVKSLFNLALDESAQLSERQQQRFSGMLIDAVANAVEGMGSVRNSVCEPVGVINRSA